MFQESPAYVNFRTIFLVASYMYPVAGRPYDFETGYQEILDTMLFAAGRAAELNYLFIALILDQLERCLISDDTLFLLLD